MKTKHIISMLAAAVISTACSDTWDDHYPTEQTNGTETLLQLVEKNPQLSDFLKVAKATHLYNNMRPTSVTYSDLLAADQALTVWAPQNGTFNADSLLALCQTAKGDSLVGQQFMANHIAHSLYNMNSHTLTNVKMYNDKLLPLTASTISSSTVVSGQYNTPATNGLLHVIDKSAPFAYNIYEGLTCLSEFSHLGQFLLTYERLELDEDRSIVAGIEDGQKVYSDSVMRRENILFNRFDNIISEDSSFAILIPTQEMWDKAYAEAKPFFNFNGVERGDSIQNYWLNVSLMQDLIYNRNIQKSLKDSVRTTSYSISEWPHHVYYKPLDEGGILHESVIGDSLAGSNGVFYRLAKWPFTKEQLYYHALKTQGEDNAMLGEYSLCTMNYRNAIGDSISGTGYLDIVPSSSSSNWKATFKVANTLSGKYEVCAVILPRTVYDTHVSKLRPNKFRATITYPDAEGKTQTVRVTQNLSNDPLRVDTVSIAVVDLPVCNYQQLEPNLFVQLECRMSSSDAAKYSREMYLDCIYLRPLSDDDSQNSTSETQNSAKARKEGKK